MTEHAPHELSAPDSLAYGEYVITNAAEKLRRDVDSLAVTASADLAVEIKTDPLGAQSPVTIYDQATERFIGGMYTKHGIRTKGEEGVNPWPEDKTPILDVHTDPIDGTKLFIEYVQALLAHKRAPACGSMVSAGASLPGHDEPIWGVVAAPFVTPEGIIRWSVGPGKPAGRLEPGATGATPLPHASELKVPQSGGVVLVASDSSERAFRAPLEKAGYRVLKYEAAVAAALSVLDPTLFPRLRANALRRGEVIVGAVMGSAKNWDVAGAMAIANERGHFISDIHGEPRDLRDGRKSAIFAVQEAIGRQLAGVVAVAL